MLSEIQIDPRTQACSSSDPHRVNSLVILGASAPLLSTARRFKNSIKTHLIELLRGKPISHRHLDGIEPGNIAMDLLKVGTAEGLALVKAFAQKVNADAILTDDDWALEWLAQNRSHFEPACRVLAPSRETLLNLWDKVYQVRLAEQCGFDVLPTYILYSTEDIAAIPDNAFPAVIRPSFLNSARPHFKARVLATRDEMRSLYLSTSWTHPPIVQRFCLGPNLVLNGVRAESGEWLGLRLFNVYRKFHGFSVSMKPIMLPAPMESAARLFVEEAGLTGPFHFELLASDKEQKAYFLEINCRLGGTTGKVIELGFDEPGLTLSAFGVAPAKSAPSLPTRHGQVTSLRLNLTQACCELLNRRDPLAYPQLPRARSCFAALQEALSVHHG